MLYPVIDIGSNTVKLAILNKERLFWEAPVYFKAVPLNLRSHVVDGKLTDEATSSLCQWIAAFQEIARRFTPNPPLAFATASLRGLSNATEVLNQIRATCGVTAFIISGKTEAYFSFLGAKNSVNAASGVTVDLGGGSTEILSFERRRVLDSASLPLGCLTWYQKY